MLIRFIEVVFDEAFISPCYSASWKSDAARDCIDIAAIFIPPSGKAKCCAIADRNVHETLGHVTIAALRNSFCTEIEARIEAFGIGLVSNNPKIASLR